MENAIHFLQHEQLTDDNIPALQPWSTPTLQRLLSVDGTNKLMSPSEYYTDGVTFGPS